jgi:ABC-type amino acid transport substrate-binding protein
MNAQRNAILTQSPRDLAHMRIGVVEGSVAQTAVHALGAKPVEFPDIAAGFAALSADHIVAFVRDAPVMIWESAGYPTVSVTDFRFKPQDYAIVLPEDSPLREEVNRALLDLIGTEEWAALEQYYFGRSRYW